MIQFKQPEIKGNLEIVAVEKEDEFEGKIEKWTEVMIHGDPDGLRSLAKLLLQLADFDQETNPNLPAGAKEHEHLQPNFELSSNSFQTIIGRLDAKATGEFHKGYIPKNGSK